MALVGARAGADLLAAARRPQRRLADQRQRLRPPRWCCRSPASSIWARSRRAGTSATPARWAATGTARPLLPQPPRRVRAAAADRARTPSRADRVLRDRARYLRIEAMTVAAREASQRDWHSWTWRGARRLAAARRRSPAGTAAIARRRPCTAEAATARPAPPILTNLRRRPRAPFDSSAASPDPHG